MNCSKNKTSELHSVVFKTDPPNKWTAEKSRKWLKDHDITRLKSVDRTKNSLRYRIVDPECFISFSTTVVNAAEGTINLVIGWYVKRPKGGGKFPHFTAPKRKKINKDTSSKSFRKAIKQKKGITFSSKLKAKTKGRIT